MSRAKNVLRNVVADTVRASGIGALLRRARRKDLVVLCYHRVLPRTQRDTLPIPELAVTPEVFEAHVAHVSRHYRCVTMREATRRLQSGDYPQWPMLAITFDDGYRDNFEFAAPILKAHGVVATFFVISGLAGSESSPWYDRLGRAISRLTGKGRPANPRPATSDSASVWLGEQLNAANGSAAAFVVEQAKRLRPGVRAEVVAKATEWAGSAPSERDRIMSREQLQALVEQGHEIGSHTRTHPLLTQLSPAELDEELGGSRAELEQMVGVPVDSLAYPNGDFNETVIYRARQSGYQRAATTMPGLNDAGRDVMRLRRLFVAQSRLCRSDGRSSSSLLELELTGVAESLFLRRSRRERNSTS